MRLESSCLARQVLGGLGSRPPPVLALARPAAFLRLFEVHVVLGLVVVGSATAIFAGGVRPLRSACWRTAENHGAHGASVGCGVGRLDDGNIGVGRNRARGIPVTTTLHEALEAHPSREHVSFGGGLGRVESPARSPDEALRHEFAFCLRSASKDDEPLSTVRISCGERLHDLARGRVARLDECHR